MRTRLSAVLVAIVVAACGVDDASSTDATTTTEAAPPSTVLAPEGFPFTDVTDRQLARLELVSPDWLVADYEAFQATKRLIG